MIREFIRMFVPVEFCAGLVSGLLFALIVYGVTR